MEPYQLRIIIIIIIIIILIFRKLIPIKMEILR